MPTAANLETVVSRRAPIPVYDSDRLIGIELEFDAGSMTFRLPSLPQAWMSKTDGSLRNGREVVLRDPVKLSELRPHLVSLQRKLQSVHTGINHLGGFHVHIGGPGWTPHVAYRVVKMYTKYQNVINTLVGNSRVGNRFAQPYNNSITENRLIEQYRLNSPATTREEAKQSRCYSVVNVAAVRCRNPAIRSVEFRQGSTTRRASNIWGWVCFLMSMVDMSHDGLTSFYDDAVARYDNTLNDLVEMLHQFEIVRGVDHVADWVTWRYAHMHQLPEPYEILRGKLIELCMVKPRGFVTISNRLGLAYPQAKILIQHALDDRAIQCARDATNRYTSEYTGVIARRDLNIMLKDLEVTK